MTKTRLTPDSTHSRASSRRIWSWIVTSSAVVGSSHRMISGSQDSAIAIITRCRMPPENSCGYARNRRSGSGMPTRRISSSARSAALALL